MWSENRQLQRKNVVYSHGHVDDISAYLCPDGLPCNFMLSGGVYADDRYTPLYHVFDCAAGRMPVIVLHDSDIHMEAIALECWMSSGQQTPLWIVNQEMPVFEPLAGLADAQVVVALRKLAALLNYTITPRFERIVYAHLRILKELDIPTSLSGLYYLSQFWDMGEFHQNIMDLPCDEQTSRRIWVDLGVEDDASCGQFDLFRAVVNQLAHDAQRSGWREDNSVSDINCLEAIRRDAVLLLPVNELSANLMLPYLVEELKSNDNKPFILLVDGTKINNEDFHAYLCSPNTGSCVGIIGANAVDQVNFNGDGFQQFAERLDCMVFLKHSTGKTAETISEVIGKFDYEKVEQSHGTHCGFFKILPEGRHSDIRLSTENRFRVMPEEITALGPGQAIIFNTSTNQIIRFN